MKESVQGIIQSRGFLIAAALVVTVEILTYVLPVENAEGAGVLLTEKRKELAEASVPEFDYIILGDSRSLSLMGHPPTEKEPYSIYNFSMPAMGPRYFPFFLEKYTDSRDRLPAAVIFSADPENFQYSHSAPLHDPHRRYSQDPQQTMAEFLYARTVKRLKYLFGTEPYPGPETGLITSDFLWEMFGHRYIRLFSIPEILRQYTGPERIFLLRESIPLLYRSYKYRESLLRYSFALDTALAPEKDIPAHCSTCEGLRKDPLCRQKIPILQDNRRIIKGIKERYGQINLSDRLTPQQYYIWVSARDKGIADKVSSLNNAEPDFTYIKKFIDKALSLNVKVVFTEMPAIQEYQNTAFHRSYFAGLEELVSGYPSDKVKILRFPEPYYPKTLFAEHVHFECEGAERLNREFYQELMPRILEFAPPDTDPARNRKLN